MVKKQKIRTLLDVIYFLRVVWFLASFLSYALPALVFVVYFFLFSLIFKGFVACGPPANRFLKDLVLAGFPQLTF